ncbi:C40 family peptidase [Papillibacter cinnamivorans]|uniref:SH3 domain-containing protein n=1 Tax=Papillibacter cinnamivorans DSM 12816 TaxID=1122930 RepID=A0A1W1ZBD9_9FIRM|nr:C40 family peptidase [Papillibacter cinnamivorans]SMC45656.1 SH3 domain-containing protein [Papillibacter cinnamivorans DSM 12816]
MKNLKGFLRYGLIAAALMVCLTVAAAAAGTSLGVATVDASSLRLRESPSTSSSILGTASTGDTVVVLEKLDGWYKVNFKATEGYMSSEYLTLKETADVTIGYGLVKATSLNMRSGPGTTYSLVSAIPGSAIVSIVGIDSGWYKVTYGGKTGYVLSDYLSITKESASSRGADEVVADSGSTAAGEEVVAYAKQFLGYTYIYGTAGPNTFDCSGFTQYVYKHFGYSLNRSAASQMSNGTSVSKANLQPGDLVLFREIGSSKAATHVGIYIGGNKFIHCSSAGGQVRYNSLSDSWYAKTYVGARRILS